MAKAKKTKDETTSAAEAAPKKPAARKKSTKPAAAPQAAQPAVPLIDTNLAAATAAKLLVHKDALAASNIPASGESSAFKQLKENLHGAGGSSTPSFLQNIAPAKKFNPSVPGRNQQIGRNQTFGADVNRSGVPRRTGG